VKTQDLMTRFPNTGSGASILYLVSSALPAFRPGFIGIFFPALSVYMARLAKRAGVKVVLNQNGVAYPGWFGKGWRAQNRTSSTLLKLADYVVYQSEFCRMSADRFAGTCSGASSVLYNPVDTETFAPGKRVWQNGLRLQLLLTGSHWGKYRVRTAIETLSYLVKDGIDATLSVAGAFCWGQSEEASRDYVSTLSQSVGVSDRVILKGSYSQQEAVGLYRSADILLHTKYNDPCPRVVVEAMACGLPVVYSATGGVAEQVGDAGAGVAGPCDWENDHAPNPRELAFAVEKVLDDYPGFRERARKRAVEKFDVAPWLDSHAAIFRRLCS